MLRKQSCTLIGFVVGALALYTLPYVYNLSVERVYWARLVNVTDGFLNPARFQLVLRDRSYSVFIDRESVYWSNLGANTSPDTRVGKDWDLLGDYSTLRKNSKLHVFSDQNLNGLMYRLVMRNFQLSCLFPKSDSGLVFKKKFGKAGLLKFSFVDRLDIYIWNTND